jgi:hypothetical protein
MPRASGAGRSDENDPTQRARKHSTDWRIRPSASQPGSLITVTAMDSRLERAGFAAVAARGGGRGASVDGGKTDAIGHQPTRCRFAQPSPKLCDVARCRSLREGRQDSDQWPSHGLLRARSGRPRCRRRCWPSWPDLGERWPARLVATAAAGRLSFDKTYFGSRCWLEISSEPRHLDFKKIVERSPRV